MPSTDDAPGFDALPNADHEHHGPEDTVKWNCFSCGRHLGGQGSGGSFDLDFGYGSSFDGTQGVCGWICDECVTQKHGRLLVRVNKDTAVGRYWLYVNYERLAEHDETKAHVASLDFFGRRQMPWGYDHNGEPYKSQGDRSYQELTATERGRIETWLFKEDEPLDRELIVKLLQALMESEARCALAESRRWEAMHVALGRARQQAERLDAEQLAQLRAREHEALAPADWRRLWEHTEWNERHFRKQEQRISAQAEEIKALRAQCESLKKRLRVE